MHDINNNNPIYSTKYMNTSNIAATPDMLYDFAFNNIGKIPENIIVSPSVLNKANFRLVTLDNGIRILNGLTIDTKNLLRDGKIRKLVNDYGLTYNEAVLIINSKQKYIFENIPLLKIILNNKELLNMFLCKPVSSNPVTFNKINKNWVTHYNYSALEANFPSGVNYTKSRLNAIYDLLVIIRPDDLLRQYNWVKNERKHSLEKHLALSAINGSRNHDIMLKRHYDLEDTQFCWVLVDIKDKQVDNIYTYVKHLESFNNLNVAMQYLRNSGDSCRIIIKTDANIYSDKYIDTIGKTVCIYNPWEITLAGDIVKLEI